MIYIDNNCTDPTYNLAFEEYVFRQFETDEPVLLLWRNEPSVIIGRFQNAIEEIDPDFIRERGIHVVRRGTGGGAVYHDLGNLNYSFIIPGAQSKVDFGTFTIPVVKALRSLGVDAVQTGRNDILAEGRKFSGNAQQFAGGKMLHHGTLMFDVNMDDVAAALRPKAGKFRSRATRSVRSRVTNLKPLIVRAESPVESPGDYAGDPGVGPAGELRRNPAGELKKTPAEELSVLGFKTLLLEWFRKEYGTGGGNELNGADLNEAKPGGADLIGKSGFRTVALTEEQLEEIVRLQNEKYRTYAWNFGRSPAADLIRGEYFACGRIEFHISLRGNRIRDVKIMGDFFSAREISELEQSLIGLDFRRDLILAALQKAGPENYFGEVTAEELADMIVSGSGR